MEILPINLSPTMIGHRMEAFPNLCSPEQIPVRCHSSPFLLHFPDVRDTTKQSPFTLAYKVLLLTLTLPTVPIGHNCALPSTESHLDLSVADGEGTLSYPSPGIPLLGARVASHQ